VGKPTTPIFFVSIGLALLGGVRRGSGILVSIGFPASILLVAAFRPTSVPAFAPAP
jgi:hypothetical protein